MPCLQLLTYYLAQRRCKHNPAFSDPFSVVSSRRYRWFQGTRRDQDTSADQDPLAIHLLSVNSYLILEGSTRSCVLVGAKPSPAGRVHNRLKWHHCHPKWANDQIQPDAAMQRVPGLGCNRSQVQTLAVGSFLSPSLVCMFIFLLFRRNILRDFVLLIFLFLMHLTFFLFVLF